jgi:asparagine synthase (glutamine-hydrolysing)
MKTYLPGDILTKVDRASMAHALEVRVPLLDHKFVEWVSGLPPDPSCATARASTSSRRRSSRMAGTTSCTARRWASRFPLAAWLRGPLADKMKQAVLNPVLLDTGIFNENYLKQMVSEHQSGLQDHSTALWQVLMFEAFLRKNGADAAHHKN